MAASFNANNGSPSQPNSSIYAQPQNTNLLPKSSRVTFTHSLFKRLTRMVGSETTAQIWNSLCEYYTAQNKAKNMQYKTMLCNTRMTRSLDDYLLKIKLIVDTLASIGHLLFAQDHIEAIINGLSKDYEVFITYVNTKFDAYTVAEIEALLMSHEVQMEKGAKELDILKSETNISQSKALTGSRGGYSIGSSSGHSNTPPSALGRAPYPSYAIYGVGYGPPGFGQPSYGTRLWI
ncbi:uncharacterized protein LOC133795619 [Humulus lupulus]|uniref:uncharacterized protein LOC133795619 n=1 Tax=Humulus lupulus TaxID=3486 RepID=UPI002B40F7FF|nr:uncharacterized protein LOC133795619 [Humulus lupulus]